MIQSNRLSGHVSFQLILYAVLNAVQIVLIKVVLVNTGVTLVDTSQLLSYDFYAEAIPKILYYPLTWLILLVGILTFSQAIAIFTRVDAMRMTVVMNVSHVVTVSMGVAFFGDPVTKNLILGFCAIMVGYWLIVSQRLEP
jgi:drug/metabolite transporter (DMT)-like permease